MKNQNTNYQDLLKKTRHIHVLNGISSILGWDQETYMPIGSTDIRAEQLETLAGLIHEAKTSKSYLKCLSTLVDIKSGKIKSSDLTKKEKTAVKILREDYLKDTKLPIKFVQEFTKLSSKGQLAWREAKEKNDFSLFMPYLQKIVDMNLKKANLLGYKDHPYDALLDLYEPGMTTKKIRSLFDHLKKALLDILKKLPNKKIDDSFLFGKFSTDKQLEFSHHLMKCVGFDVEKGRLDLSSHPFSSSCHPTDSRITTRIHPDSLMSNISAVLHECGHSLYEMGLPEEYYGTPLCEAVSLGLHESQSRFWETRIGQSKAFWTYQFPLLKKAFPSLKNISLDKFYKAINKVEPSLIRIEADEVTYSLHVILRFELEVALIDGSLAVKDLPKAWNAKMQELLGITPKSDSEGCLQDIHWSMGAFGYFPTYTLGNLYAAQFFEKFALDNPNWEEKVAKGDCLFIKNWLNHHIHKHGREFNSLELVKLVTNNDFTAEAYIQYLKNKYLLI